MSDSAEWGRRYRARTIIPRLTLIAFWSMCDCRRGDMLTMPLKTQNLRGRLSHGLYTGKTSSHATRSFPFETRMNKHEKDWESIIVELTHPVLIPPYRYQSLLKRPDSCAEDSDIRPC